MSPHNKTLSIPRRTSYSIRTRLTVPLAALACLVVTSAGATVTQIRLQRSDALTINMAGRQRMLLELTSYRAALSCCSGPALWPASEAPAGRGSLAPSAPGTNARSLFEQTHRALLSGGQTFRDLPMTEPVYVPAVATPVARAHLRAVGDQWRALLGLLAEAEESRLRVASVLDLRQRFAALEQQEATLLQELDKVVALIESDASRRQQLVLYTQIAFLIVGIFVMVLIYVHVNSSIVLPLARLTGKVRARHRPPASCGETSIDEVELLSNELDEMSRQIDEHIAGFEGAVRARTAELEAEIAHRKQVEAQLVAAKAMAEAGYRAKSAFLRTMSHEIRTPGAGVLSATGLLLETPLSEQQHHLANVAYRSCVNQLRLLDDILLASKLEAGWASLEHSDFSVAALIAEVVELFSVSARERGTRILAELASALPRSVQGDPLRLRQVLANLIGNAVKFTEGGTITVRARADALDSSQVLLRCEVEDDGLGIPDHFQSRLFDEFTQLDDSARRAHGGVGLGLSICHKLVTLMGGQIGVTSVDGEGSTFWFAIPVRMSEAGGEVIASGGSGPRPREGSHAASPVRAGSGSILIVEDERTNLALTSAALKGVGWTVVTASSGAAAIAACRQQDFALILMDCEMPGMTGGEAALAIRQEEAQAGRPRAMIVALTAHALAEDQALCVTAGMDGVLVKPISPHDLREAVASYVDRGRRVGEESPA